MPLELDLRAGNLNWCVCCTPSDEYLWFLTSLRSIRARAVGRLYLTLIIVIVAVILFYLFYFGRLFASVLSFFLRTFLWRRHRIWIDIGSLQFSPLGGRLLFRDVRYVGENEQVRIAMGTITWRYWLSRVRQDSDLQKGKSSIVLYRQISLQSPSR